jgi:hypothetical protein
MTAMMLALAACGGHANAAPVRKLRPLKAPNVPTTMLGLTVSPESTKKAEGERRPYLDGVGLYSLRKGPLLEATLQIGRFATDADYKSANFQGSVVAQIGTTTPQELRMSSSTVFLTSARNQTLAVWFRDRYFFILTTRDDYKTPRSLLRTALEIHP